MRKLIAAGLGSILAVSAASGQQPPVPSRPNLDPFPASSGLPPLPLPALPTMPAQPAPTQTPGRLPPLTAQPGTFPTAPNRPTPAQSAPQQQLPPGAAMQSAVPLPYPEQKLALRATDVAVKRVVGGWEVWAGQKVLRNTGDNETNARDVARVFRELRPTEWVTIGNTKAVVEYGLTNGRPTVTGAPLDAKENGNGAVTQTGGFSMAVAAANPAKVVRPIDLRSARVEAVRGTWVVRDDNNILLNFGPDKGGAEQAGAVIQRYGFNRLGVVGVPAAPTMNYLFVSTDEVKPPLGGAVMAQAQIDSLTRTGIPIPGVGYIGEMIKIDPRKVEVRKDRSDWVVAFGPEVLGRFGPTEWTAREAARTIQDAKFTEFCRLGGTSNLTFFLVNEKPPTRAPFNAQGRPFNIDALKVQQINQKWAVTDAGRQLFEVGSAQEGEIVVRVLKAYGFDQVAHLSARGAQGGITFFVKNRR